MTFYNQDILASQQALTFPDNPISISPFKVNPITQYALPHVDAGFLFARPEGPLSSHNQQFLSPLPPVVEPPPTVPAKAQAARPSNPFMLFRSEFVKQQEYVGRRQQELSIMAACAWRALGTDGQTGWYEKAALAKGPYDGTNAGLKVTRQRPKAYRPRVDARDVVHADSMRPFRETYATFSPALPARRKMRKSIDESISSPLCVHDPMPIVRTSTPESSSALGQAVHPPSFFAAHHNRPEEANISPTSSIQSDNSYGDSDVHTIGMGHLNYVVAAPIYPAASATPLSPYGSFSSQDVAGFPSPTQYPSPVSPSDWNNGFIEPHYNLPSALSAAGPNYFHVGLYDENSSRQDPFRDHTRFP